MLNPKQRIYSEHLEELAKEGEEIARLEKPSQFGDVYIQDTAKIQLHSWYARVKNVLENVFGKEGAHTQHFYKVSPEYLQHSHEVYPIVGILQGAKDDLDNGFLTGQEFLIAGDILDSVLAAISQITG